MRNRLLKNSIKGFTLIELLVATMVFTVAIVLFSQIYVNVLKSERIAYGYLDNISGLEYTIDFMSREIRMGTSFQNPNYTTLRFKNRDGQLVEYYLSNNQIYRKVNSQAYPISPPKITIKSLNFSLQGDPPLQRVSISLTFSTSFKEGLLAESTIQTSVTPRIIYTIVNR